MSEYVIANKSDLVSIADNLRAKTGSTTTMSLSQMSNSIANISTSQTQESVQPDWNQNNSTAADYIKNRPFYKTDEVELTSVITEQTVTFELNSDTNMYTALIGTLNLETGKTYRVIFDNVSYDCLAFGNDTVYLGNPAMMDSEDTGEPFIFASFGTESAVVSYNSSTSHTFSISEITSVYKTIPKECLSSDVVFCYSFTDPAPADEMVTAIELFNAGKVNISWNGIRVLYAKYNSDDESIYIGYMYSEEESGGMVLKTYANKCSPYTDEQGNSVYSIMSN